MLKSPFTPEMNLSSFQVLLVVHPMTSALDDSDEAVPINYERHPSTRNLSCLENLPLMSTLHRDVQHSKNMSDTRVSNR